MKLLLDEQIPRKLARLFPVHWYVKTVQEMGWSGTSNGALLSVATQAGFEAMITADKNIQYQQNPSNLPFPIVILAAISTRIVDMAPLVPAAISLLDANASPGIHRIESTS